MLGFELGAGCRERCCSYIMPSNGEFPLSLEGAELGWSGVLDGDGRGTAEEESCETKQEQDEGWHEPRVLGYIILKVKLLWADGILANNNPEGELRICNSLPPRIPPEPVQEAEAQSLHGPRAGQGSKSLPPVAIASQCDPAARSRRGVPPRPGPPEWW